MTDTRNRILALAATALMAVAANALILPPDSVSIADSIRHANKAQLILPAGLEQRIESNGEAAANATESENANNAGASAHRSRTGFRVEVFADNGRSAKLQAASKKRMMSARFPQQRVYLVFEAPFWRVRMGDFTSRAAAESALADVRRVFPALRGDLRVVRSAINP